MRAYIFDCETNGLLDQMDVLHCLVLKDLETGELISCANLPKDLPADTQKRYRQIYAPISTGLRLLSEADLIIAHNALGFDIPAIQKLYPDTPIAGTIRDSLICARLIWPADSLKQHDFKLLRKKRLPGNLIGRHALQAWGYRLGLHKGGFSQHTDWQRWSPEMQEYCEQDVLVTELLWQRIQAKGFSEQAIDTEHHVQSFLSRSQAHGLYLSLFAAKTLQKQLEQQQTMIFAELEKCPSLFSSEKHSDQPATSQDYEETHPSSPSKDDQEDTKKDSSGSERGFIPTSTKQIIRFLQQELGWQPKYFDQTGKPLLHDEILQSFDHPAISAICQYRHNQKVLAGLAVNKTCLLSYVEGDQRIRPEAFSNIDSSGDIVYRHPNFRQISQKDWTIRENWYRLFTAPPGRSLVLVDCNKLLIRSLSHHLLTFQNTFYRNIILQSDKGGADIHDRHAEFLNLESDYLYRIKGKSYTARTLAKNWFYDFIAGANDSILGAHFTAYKHKEKDIGQKSRSRFMKLMFGLPELLQYVKHAVSQNSPLQSLDGRLIHPPSQRQALPCLLQNTATTLRKYMLLEFDKLLQKNYRFCPGKHYEFLLNEGDTILLETDKSLAKIIGPAAQNALMEASIHLQFNCPLQSQFVIGENWADMENSLRNRAINRIP